MISRTVLLRRVVQRHVRRLRFSTRRRAAESRHRQDTDFRLHLIPPYGLQQKKRKPLAISRNCGDAWRLRRRTVADRHVATDTAIIMVPIVHVKTTPRVVVVIATAGSNASKLSESLWR